MGYITIKSGCEASFTEKHSEFISYLCPVKNNDEAVSFINEIRAKHRKATHNVYAYIVRDNNISRYSDDGEPQGTAGVPVLEVLKKNGLTDVCCVVTRYFGGILLGGGGLVRAYSHSARLAVDNAQIMDMCECFHVRIKINYSLYGKIAYVLPEFETKQLSSDFGDVVMLDLLVKQQKHQPFIDKLTDITNGKVEIVTIAELFEDFS